MYYCTQEDEGDKVACQNVARNGHKKAYKKVKWERIKAAGCARYIESERHRTHKSSFIF